MNAAEKLAKKEADALAAAAIVTETPSVITETIVDEPIVQSALEIDLANFAKTSANKPKRFEVYDDYQQVKVLDIRMRAKVNGAVTTTFVISQIGSIKFEVPMEIGVTDASIKSDDGFYPTSKVSDAAGQSFYPMLMRIAKINKPSRGATSPFTLFNFKIASTNGAIAVNVTSMWELEKSIMKNEAVLERANRNRKSNWQNRSTEDETSFDDGAPSRDALDTSETPKVEEAVNAPFTFG
jgi:hypothetical protein